MVAVEIFLLRGGMRSGRAVGGVERGGADLIVSRPSILSDTSLSTSDLT